MANNGTSFQTGQRGSQSPQQEVSMNGITAVIGFVFIIIMLALWAFSGLTQPPRSEKVHVTGITAAQAMVRTGWFTSQAVTSRLVHLSNHHTANVPIVSDTWVLKLHPGSQVWYYPGQGTIRLYQQASVLKNAENAQNSAVNAINSSLPNN